MKRLLPLLSVLALLASNARADEHVGTLTQLEGLVQVFSRPSKTLPKDKPTNGGTLALFEGDYYVVTKGKVGDPVENGNIVRTVPGAKARVVFENGDQFQVGSGTAYRVAWDTKTAEKAKLQAKIDLMYGKFRGVVSKDGPRKKMLLRTPVAVMGVRGTDFFVEQNAKTGETEFTIIRGAVEVTPTVSGKSTVTPKTFEVKSGYSAVVSEAAAKPAVASSPAPGASSGKVVVAATEMKVELRQTALDELMAIQETSALRVASRGMVSKEVVAKAEAVAAKANTGLVAGRAAESRADAKSAASTEPSREVAAKVAELEKKALESTLKEIREYQPELHAKLSEKPENASSLEGVNAASVNALMPTAPKLSPARRRKPVIQELDSAEDERAYERYFKRVD